METDAVIVGGGIAGLQCAWELACMGLHSTVVEKAPFLGGHVARFACKATDSCQRCGACALEDILRRTGSSDLIGTLPRTKVARVERQNGEFSVSLERRPQRVFPDKCNDCGECEKACPAAGALARMPGSGGLFINEEKCLHFIDGSCDACARVCPESAVVLNQEPESLELHGRAIVVASGFEPFDPQLKARFGYRLVPGVVTALELESMLRDDTFTRGEGEGYPGSVAFIQCVGSRDAKIGRNYCSRVCCGYAVRMARLLKKRSPSFTPTIFYMDMQNFERYFDKRLDEVAEEVNFVRSIPAEIRKGADGRPEVIYHGSKDRRVIESFDLVVLSTGISPVTPEVFAHLGLNRDGFLGPDGEGVTTQRDGVFVAGTVQGPRSIEETISHAIEAAGKAASHVREKAKGGAR